MRNVKRDAWQLAFWKVSMKAFVLVLNCLRNGSNEIRCRPMWHLLRGMLQFFYFLFSFSVFTFGITWFCGIQFHNALDVCRSQLHSNGSIAFYARWINKHFHFYFRFFAHTASRYSMKKSTIAASVSKDALDVSFWHQPNKLFQIGASLILNKRTSKALGSLYYQMDMKDVVIKGMVDSDLSVGCTYNKWVLR